MRPHKLLLALILFVSLTTTALILIVQDLSLFHTKVLFQARLSKIYSFMKLSPNISSTMHTHAAHKTVPKVSLSLIPDHVSSSNRTGRRTKSVVKMSASDKAPVLSNRSRSGATRRPLQCNGCFHSNFTILLENPDICSPSTGTDPQMIMMITSTSNSFELRQAIRDTWASLTRGNTAHLRHVFLLATSGTTKLTQAIKAEGDHYKDLLVSDFVDSYYNLTYKTLVGMRWIVQHCRNVKFFLKTDQDMYIFPEKLLRLARLYERVLKRSVGGQCQDSAKPWRKPKTKYYASWQQYPQLTYPGFCSGTGYISTLDVAQQVVQASPDIPFFHLEDVYLSLVLNHIRYRLTNFIGFAQKISVCKEKARARRAITIHNLNATMMRQLWTNSLCAG